MAHGCAGARQAPAWHSLRAQASYGSNQLHSYQAAHKVADPCIAGVISDESPALHLQLQRLIGSTSAVLTHAPYATG